MCQFCTSLTPCCGSSQCSQNLFLWCLTHGAAMHCPCVHLSHCLVRQLKYHIYTPHFTLRDLIPLHREISLYLKHELTKCFWTLYSTRSQFSPQQTVNAQCFYKKKSDEFMTNIVQINLPLKPFSAALSIKKINDV